MLDEEKFMDDVRKACREYKPYAALEDMVNDHKEIFIKDGKLLLLGAFWFTLFVIRLVNDFFNVE